MMEACANLICVQFGCQGHCGRSNLHQRAIPAPFGIGPTKGCICPPASEKTCQRPDCGRKPQSFTVTA